MCLNMAPTFHRGRGEVPRQGPCALSAVWGPWEKVSFPSLLQVIMSEEQATHLTSGQGCMALERAAQLIGVPSQHDPTVSQVPVPNAFSGCESLANFHGFLPAGL